MLGITIDPRLLQKLESRRISGCIGVICLDPTGFEGWELSSGQPAGHTIRVLLDGLLSPAALENGEILFSRRTGSDWFLLVALDEQNETLAKPRLAKLAGGLARRMEYGLGLLGKGRITVAAGYALMNRSEEVSERSIYDLVKLAWRSSGRPAANTELDERKQTFSAILQQRAVSAVYQPIVALEDAAVFGYEALARGPANSIFQSPLELFGYAEANGGLHALDRLAREKAIEGVVGLSKDQRIFLNIPAAVVHDPDFVTGRTVELLKEAGLTPRNVVLEITERSSIEDFETAKRTLAHYRSQGYQLAIDDAGAGYSSLQAIAELQPDYIKVDRSLIRNVHQDKMKETMLETFVTFSRKMNIRIIAEGVEQPEELKKLISMGVHYVQGYLLGRPAPAPTPIEPRIRDELIRMTRMQALDCVLPIGSLAVPIRTFPVSAPISEVANYLKKHEEVSGAVIVEGGAPAGLVTRDRLFQQLAGQYGVSLYWNRPISLLMDKEPLIVDESMPTEQVSRLAMSRELTRLYDWVVVTAEGRVLGAATIQRILEAITNLQMETARVANPLTGLPGNVQINREMNKRLAGEQPFSVIYADLDYFKWFNDRFGFQRGDQLIQYTADVLQQSLYACGHPKDFVGHVGGDDFIVLTEAPDAQAVCEEILRRFQQGMSLLYDEEDLVVLDRNGNPVDADGVHLSLSLVICRCLGTVTKDQISRTAAALKKRAKTLRGNVYVAASLEGA